MKLLNHNRGQMRIIEVLLASFVIMFALSFTNVLAVTPLSPKYEADELVKLGYNVLHDLDKQNLLSRFVYTGDWGNLAAALRVTLPLDVYFTLTVYDLNGTELNSEAISYGTAQTFLRSKNVASVSYVLSGYSTRINATHYQALYDPRVLLLQLKRG